MHHTRSVDRVGEALVEMMSFFASPRRDQALLREAGIDIDRALFPLLVRLARGGPKGVAALAEEVGRDHTTVSRQLAKLQSLGLISRPEPDEDRRLRSARLTAKGEAAVQDIVGARRRLLSDVLAGWADEEIAALAELNLRLVGDLKRAAARGGG